MMPSQLMAKILSLLILCMQPTALYAHSLDEVIAGDHRSEKNKARDVYRHPKETLDFFGIEEEMTVVEAWPSAGWYTEIIAPYLNDSGQYISASFDINSDRDYFKRMAQLFLSKLNDHPELYGNVEHGIFELPDRTEISKPSTADMVLTFRNIHNWMARGQETIALQAFFKVLKPGGTLGVVEHRGDPAIAQDLKATSGYVNEEFMIELAESVGFILEASSEINANPKDSKNHRDGVWTLPPTYEGLNDDEKIVFENIGESDRFTLRFKKPF